MVENVIQIKSGMTINIGASVKIQKNIMSAEKTIIGILLDLIAKIVNIKQVLLTIQ